MPTITFRVTDNERAQLDRDAHARGVPVAVVIRDALRFRDEHDAHAARLDDHEDRLRRLEQLAGDAL